MSKDGTTQVIDLSPPLEREGYVDIAESADFGAHVTVTPTEIIVVTESGDTSNTMLAANFIKDSPEVSDFFGFVLSKSEAGEELRSPNVLVLNAKKDKLRAAGIEVNTAEFVAVEDDILSRDEYLAYFVEGKIPVAQLLRGAAHDALEHGMGFAIMSGAVFDTLRRSAQKALISGDDSKAQKALELIDTVSTALLMCAGEATEITPLYAEFYSGGFSSIRASRDAKAQRRVIEQARSFAHVQMAA